MTLRRLPAKSVEDRVAGGDGAGAGAGDVHGALGLTNGFAGVTIGVLISAAMFLVERAGFVIGPLRRAGVMTIPELFQKRFATKVRWLAGLFLGSSLFPGE